MKISDLIKELEIAKSTHGDIQVSMQATLLKDGFSSNNSDVMPDVFESTVESSRIYEAEGVLGKRLRLFWQTQCLAQ